MRSGRWQIVFVEIDEAGDNVAEANLSSFVLVILIEQLGDGLRILGDRALYLIDTIFNALGDVDFAFTG